jgi:ribonucleoside-diphosphate reductase alpha chain
MVKVDYSRDELLTEQGKELVSKYYLVDGEQSPQDAFARAATAFCGGDAKLAQRIYDYASKGWFMYASPVLSNAPKVNRNGKITEWNKGLPISCFLAFVPDSLED